MSRSSWVFAAVIFVGISAIAWMFLPSDAQRFSFLLGAMATIGFLIHEEKKRAREKVRETIQVCGKLTADWPPPPEERAPKPPEKYSSPSDEAHKAMLALERLMLAQEVGIEMADLSRIEATWALEEPHYIPSTRDGSCMGGPTVGYWRAFAHRHSDRATASASCPTEPCDSPHIGDRDLARKETIVRLMRKAIAEPHGEDAIFLNRLKAVMQEGSAATLKFCAEYFRKEEFDRATAVLRSSGAPAVQLQAQAAWAIAQWNAACMAYDTLVENMCAVLSMPEVPPPAALRPAALRLAFVERQQHLAAQDALTIAEETFKQLAEHPAFAGDAPEFNDGGIGRYARQKVSAARVSTRPDPQAIHALKSAVIPVRPYAKS